MAIKQVDKYFLGSILTNPKVYYAKIKELIDGVNGLTDGTITPNTIVPASGTLAITGNETVSGTLAVTGTSTLTGQVALNGGLTVGKATVTQLTSITTGVTVNASAGVITTVSSTLAAGSNATFIVTNSKAIVGSVVMLTVDDSSTAGLAKVNVQTVAAGVFSINITNIHATNAFNNVLRIHFLVV